MWTTNKLGLGKLAWLITYKLLLRQWQCIAAPQKLIVNIKNDLGTCEQKALCPQAVSSVSGVKTSSPYQDSDNASEINDFKPFSKMDGRVNI